MKKIIAAITLLFSIILVGCVADPSWDDTRFSVAFFTNIGGTYVPTQNFIEPNTTIAQPATPTRPGATFTGWYTESNHQNLFDFNTPITRSIVLYAGWDYITYTITWHNITEEERIALELPTTFNAFTSRIDFAEPSRVGYAPRGWFTVPTFGFANLIDHIIPNQFTADQFRNLEFWFQWIQL